MARLLAIGMLALAGRLFAQEQPLMVTAIHIDGLKKTRDSYMQTVLKKYRDIPVSELDIHAVETTLQTEGIFETAAVEILTEQNPLAEDEQTAVLHITVKEKTSFIPLPFAASSDGNAMGGLFLLDTNAFGVKDMIIAGGVFSSKTLIGMATFAKPSLALTKPGFSVSGAVNKSEKKFIDLNKNELITYTATGFSVQAAVTDKLTEHSQASLAIGYRQSAASSVEAADSCKDAASDYRALSAAVSWSMATQDWNGWFLSGKSLSASGTMRFYQDGEVAPSAEAKIFIEQPLPFITPRLRFVTQASAALWHNEHISALGDGSAVSVTILPDDFHSAKLAGSHAGFEWAFAKARWAMFSVYANYQTVFCEDADSTMRFTHGFSAGTRMYLTKIAFPALAFGGAYNVTLRQFKYSASFGMAM